MVLSILICTYNRKNFLQLCLDSIIYQVENIKDKKIEIIIIDNNSKDDTKIFIESYESTIPIVYFLEKKQGLSYARNKGISIAKGEYIAFVDDDATINENWTSSLLKAIEEIKADVFGGPIFPRFEINCPKWIDQNYFIRQFKQTNGFLGPLTAREGFSGGNMCIHRSIFDKVGRFDVTLGMKGNQLGLGEESEFFYRIYKTQGMGKLYNLQKMSITHFESKSKLTKEYLKNRISLSGMQFAKRTINEAKIIGFLIVFAKLLKQTLGCLINLILNNKFRYLKNRWVIIGLVSVIFKKK